jgi:hypothetical protein
MADILQMIQIAAPANVAHGLVATATGFRQWWAEDVTETGDGAELGFFNRQTIYRVKLVSNTPSRVEWLNETGAEWEGTRLVFELESRGAGCSLKFAHAGWANTTDYFRSCNTTWGELLYRIKWAAEGKSQGPLFMKAGFAYA